MRTTIKGTFEVSVGPAEDALPEGMARMNIEDKRFAGPLAGSSQGAMFAHRTAVKGSAGYVAMERVEATLEGRSGTFFLQHFGVMSGDDSRLIVEVIPDSATGELVGLSGEMSIDIVDGAHHYTFTYALP